MASPTGAVLIGGPAHVAAKSRAYSEALDGIDRVGLQLDGAGLPNDRVLHSIELMGKEMAAQLQ